MKRTLTICLIFVAVVVLFLLIAIDSRLKLVNYEIKTDKISGEVRLALITDLHNCIYGENQAKLIEAIEKENPDIVLLGGDIFDNVYINDNSRLLIDSIAGKYKTYYVSGNHEWWGKETYKHFKYLESAGVTILRGDTDMLKIRGNTITVSGIDDPEVDVYDSYTPFSEQLDNAGNSINDEHYNILLSHRPELAENYFNYDFDLVLSGHAHGGQFRIPLVMNGFFAPNQGFLPKLAGGEYDFGNSKMIVSRGLAKENINLPRIFNRPELVFITLARE